MPVAWLIAPYKRRAHPTDVVRYCAVNDLTERITADGGEWTETEVLGDRAIVKVRASDATLNQLAGSPGVRRLPLNVLQAPLGALPTAARSALRGELEAMGYPPAEITGALGANLDRPGLTLGDILRFAAQRRRQPRYDAATDAIVFDGPEVAPRPVEDVDARVTA